MLLCSLCDVHKDAEANVDDCNGFVSENWGLSQQEI